MIDFQIENDDLKNQQLNQHFYFENWLMITFQIRNGAIYIGPTRNAFSLKEIAIFFKIAPIKNHKKLLTIIKKSWKIMKNHKKSSTRSAFSLKEMAIFFKIAPTYFHRGNEREEHSLSNNCHIVPLDNSL